MWVLIVVTLLAPTGSRDQFATQGKVVSMQQFSSQEACDEASKKLRPLLNSFDNVICVKG